MFFLGFIFGFVYCRSILKKVDYSLLLTFIAFFIFVGNLGNIPAVKDFISVFIEGREFISGVFLSQLISNVPAAIMLSNFTENVPPLLLGVNVGGLGTLVASLASLISFKLYIKTSGAKISTYILIFTIYNVITLLLLCAAVFLGAFFR